MNVTKNTIIDSIRSGCNSLELIKKSTGACTGKECRTKNPSQKCCSQDIIALIELYGQILETGKITSSPCCCCKNEKKDVSREILEGMSDGSSEKK